MITEEEYDKLNYMQQEKYLARCHDCQLKFSPFTMWRTPNYNLSVCPWCALERLNEKEPE